MSTATKRLVIGIDPGLTTGFVVYDTILEEVIESKQTQDQMYVTNRLKAYRSQSVLAVIIEDFVGAGPRDPMAIHTIKTLGLHQGVSEWLGFVTIIRAPQSRRPFVELAKQAKGMPAHNKHAADAMAHVYSYLDSQRKEDQAAARKKKGRKQQWKDGKTFLFSSAPASIAARKSQRRSFIVTHRNFQG